MDNRIKAALEAYDARKKKREEETEKSNKGSSTRTYDEKISSALEAYDKRLISQVNQDYINSFIADANDFLGSAEEEYKGLGWSNASSVYKARSEKFSDIERRSTIVSRWLDSQKGSLDEETYNNIYSSLDSIKTGTSNVVNAFKQAQDYYSQFKTEDDYKEAVRKQEEYTAKLDYDIDAGQAEIDKLKANRAEIESLKAEFKQVEMESKKGLPSAFKLSGYHVAELYKEHVDKCLARLKEINDRLAELGSAEDLDAAISEKERHLSEAKRLQEWYALGSVGDPDSEHYDPNFDAYSVSGADTPYTAFGDMTIHKGKGGYKASSIDKYRAAAVALYEHEGNATPKGYDKYGIIDKYRGMNDTEFATFAYYLGKDQKEGTNLAEQYIDSIEETLNSREAEDRFEGLEGKWALELLFGVEAGIDQFASGVENLFSDKDYIPVTSTQMTSQMVREDLGDSDFKIFGSTIGQIAYDATTTTANMLPSILTSTAIGLVNPGAGAVVGAGLLGASASGNAYAEMLNLGYTNDQARDYAVLVGASEAGLQYLLGGIGKLGGKATGNALSKVVSKIDNAFARVAIRLGGEMVSEGIEEGLQTVLEAWFKSEVTGMDFEAPDIDEVLYSSLLGAISSAGIGGVSTIAGGVREAKANKALVNAFGGQSQALVDDALGSQFSEVQAIGQQYQDKLQKGKSLSGYNLRELLETTDNSKIKSAVFKRLGELGETTDVTAVGEVLIKYARGEKLSSKDYAILNSSTAGHQVLAELNAENIESGGLANTWAENIGTRTVRPEVYNRGLYNLAEEVAGVTPAVDGDPTVEKKYEVSESGKTTYNGEEVTIKGIDSVKDGEVSIRLDNGETVKAGDVEFSSDDEAILYSMVAMTGGSVDTANELLGAYTTAKTPAATYAAEALRAYRYGRMGIENSLADLTIPDAQKRIAYNRGRIDAMTDASQRPKAAVTKKTKSAKPKRNGIFYEDKNTYNEERATDIQKASIKGIEFLAKFSPNLEYHVYHSELKDGKRVAYIDGVRVENAANGFFTDGNKIYIDLNAGNAGEGTMLYTLSHEITHDIRAWNAEGFKTLADFLFEHYGKNDISVDDLIEKQKGKIEARLKRDGKPIPSEDKLFDKAYEELVADAMSSMLADPKAYEKLADLKKRDASVFKKLGEAIKKILDKLKSLLGIYEGHRFQKQLAQEAKYVSQFAPEVYEKLQDLYLKAFVDAQANIKSAEKTLADNGIAVNEETESASLFSVRDVLSDEQRKKVSTALATRFGVTQQEAMDWLKAETSMASLILNPKYSEYLDYTPDPNEVAIKQNSDYPQGTVDFSPICAKRREFTSVMNNILRLFPNHVFAATDLAKIRTIMQEEGMTIPCGICYVEDRRQLDTIVAQNFIDSLKLYREGSKTRPDGKPFNTNQLKGLRLVDGDSYTPSVYELVSLEGLNVLKEKNPNMAEAWVKFNNARGMQAVRLLANEAEYKRQILKYSNKTVQSKNDHGGLRVYSFSDAEMFHLIDIIQVITDSATVGLYLQGYTKVNEYARTVKDTGEKLNRSLIPKGELGYHIEDGKVVLDYDTVEGIDINHPDFFDNKDNPDVGNITIGVSDVQIRAAMVSDFVDQIIPFHTGQSDEVLGEKGIATWSNYKDFQTEKDIATGKVSEHQINIYTEVLQVLEKEGKPITKRTFVEKFLQVCKENGLTPRFSQFLNTNEKGEYVYTEGYHKMLVDFKTFAQTEVGEYLPQRSVKPIFDNEYITKILKDYVKSQKVKDAELAESMPKVIERITNEIVKADDTMFSDRETLYSVREIVGPSGKNYGIGVFLDSNLLTALTEEERVEMVKEYVKELGGSVFTAYDPNHNAVDVHLVESTQKFKNKGGKRVPVTKDMTSYLNNEVKQEAIALVDELIVTSTFRGTEPATHPHDWVDNNGANDWDVWTTYIQDKENTVWEAKLRIANSTSGEKILYDIFPIEMVEQSGTSDTSTTDPIVSQDFDSVNRKYSDRDVVDISNAEYVKMYHHFGSTKNYEVAGYLLCNGIMLDFSGKHWGDDYSTSRQVDHRDIQEVLDDRGNNGVNAMIDMISNGNIRLMPETGGICLAVKPNATQMSVLRGYFNHFKGEVVVDIDKVGGDTIHSWEYTRGTSSTKILGDIKAYFDEGVVPEKKADGETDIRQFLYSDRDTAEYSDADTKYSIREEAPPKKTKEGYKVFVVKNGKLYPPMVANPNAEDTPVGVWLNADVGARAPDSKTGRAQVKAGGKGTQGGSGSLAFRPGWHLGETPLATQFDRLNPETGVKELFPENFVWALCDIAADHDYQEEAMSYGRTKSGKFQHSLAGLPRLPVDGYYKYRTNPNPDTVPWLITGAMKVKRLLSDAEVNAILAEKGLPPKQRVGGDKTLADLGLSEYEGVVFSDRDSESISTRSLLANALEGAAQNDIERQKLAQYKEKISLIEAEQAKLSEIRLKIRELSFAKGPRDTEQIRSLQFEEKQAANRINTYDRQLLNLQATTALKNVLEREKRMAYDKAKREGKQALADYREKTAATQRELITRWQDSRKKAVEGRNKTEMRHKIKDIVSDLNKLLLNPTKEKHVPIGLQKPVAEALEIINMDTVGAEERVAKYDALIAKAKDPDKIRQLTATRDRIQMQGENLAEKLSALKTAYDEIVDSDDPLIANSNDDVISERMKLVIQRVGNTPIRDMSLAQLEDVYDMYKMVLTTVRNADKAFKAAKGESISILAGRVMEEVESVGGKKAYRLKGTDGIDKFNWNNQKPIYAFERIGSSTLTDLYGSMRSGEDTWATDVSEARAYYLERYKKYHYDSWDFKKRFGFTSTSGMNFELSLDQIMSLYAYSKRAQAKDHLKKGGIVFDETTEVTVKSKLGIPLKFNPTQATAYNLSDDTLADIIDKLTPEQKSFVDEMQDYLSTVMGDKGNEVSLELYGIKLFKDKNYFPLKSATQFMAKAKEQQQGEVKVKNKGMTQSTVPKASNPIVLTPFMDVWADHVNEMSMYHAFVLPMEDFYRVYNYRTPTSETMATESVEMFIQNAYGKGATQYIDQLLKDLNGGARTDPRETVGKALVSKFKKAAVMASLSVVVQQPTAMVRAMALVDAKHFGIAPITRGILRTFNAKKHKAKWEEVKKYAPVAIIKEMGYFDTNMGRSTKDFITAKDYSGIGEKAKALFADGNYRDEKLSRLPALADELAWISIWEAVKRETLSKHKSLSPNSEEFLKKVGERFTEVVTKTQVYDSVLSRSGLMRSKSGLVNMWTSFMGEPTTSLNMLQDALLKAKRGNKKYAGKVVGAVFGSVVLNAALVSLVYAMRDDDEDETYAEKYLARVSTEILDGINPLTYIPIVKDVWSIAQGFDIERADMSLLTDLIDSVQKTVTVMAKDTEDMDEDELAEHQKQVADALWSIGDNISSIAGLPVKNIRREIKGFLNLGKTIAADSERETTAGSLMDEIWEDVKDSIPVVGWLPDEGKSDKLYDAIVSGDAAYRKRIESGYETKSALDSALRKALRENDPRIKEAAEARMKGDISGYMRIAKSIISEGHFSQDNVVAAINAEISAMSKGESTSSASDKESSLFKMDDYYAAIVGRDQATAAAVKEDVIRTAVKNGKDREEAEANFVSSFVTYLSNKYEEGKLSNSEAKSMLTKYADKSDEEAASKVQYWAFKQEYPDYDLTESAVSKYYSDVKPSGISVKVYYDYSTKKSKCKGTDTNGDGKTDSGSLKREILKVINSLPISAKQKDALYFAEGWAESTLHEAPWR